MNFKLTSRYENPYSNKGFDGLLLHTFVAAVMSKTFKQQQGVHSQIPNKLDSGPIH
jgi:hypothetical protein